MSIHPYTVKVALVEGGVNLLSGGTTLKLDDPSPAHMKFAGALYKNRPLSSFLDNFKVISHIDSYFDEKGVLHFTAAR